MEIQKQLGNIWNFGFSCFFLVFNCATVAGPGIGGGRQNGNGNGSFLIFALLSDRYFIRNASKSINLKPQQISQYLPLVISGSNSMNIYDF